MLKYQKLKEGSRPDSLLVVVLSGIQLLLVIIGLIGISVQFFRDKGWLKQWLSSLMHANVSTLIVAVPVIILMYLVGISLMGSKAKHQGSSRTGDAMLYIMMLVGLWFAYSFITTGDI
jgi:hypothetical protein